MARMRMLKPQFFLNEQLADIDPLGRILFAGLWCLADREGRLEDRPRKIKAEVLPYDETDVNGLLGALHAAGFIVRYEVDDQRYIQVVNFGKHQTPHQRETPSSIPSPSLAQGQAQPRSLQAQGLPDAEHSLGDDEAQPRRSLSLSLSLPKSLSTTAAVIVNPAPALSPAREEPRNAAATAAAWNDDQLHQTAGQIAQRLRLEATEVPPLRVLLMTHAPSPPYLLAEAVKCAEYYAAKRRRASPRLYDNWLQEAEKRRAQVSSAQETGNGREPITPTITAPPTHSERPAEFTDAEREAILADLDALVDKALS